MLINPVVSLRVFSYKTRMPSPVDMSGKKFRHLTAVEPLSERYFGQVVWLCRCDCGKAKKVSMLALKQGKVSSCGCKNKENRYTRNISGQRFGNLIAIERIVNDSEKRTKWRFQCDCGNIREMRMDAVCSQNQTHCGCQTQNLLRRSNLKNSTHRMSKHPAYAVWNTMRQRCYNPSHVSYKNYGALGISVCKEWESFEIFWRDMGPTYKKGLSIDRKDNNKGYCLLNCKWSTPLEQSLNRRKNIRINTPNGSMTVREVSEKYNINSNLLYDWHSKGTLSYKFLQKTGILVI